MKEILIRLEDELYEQCKNTKLTEENEGFDFHIIKSVANGIVLPKGHGRLIDENELLKMTESYKSELGRLKADPFVKCGIETVESFIKEMSPIIEADKENKE